VKFNRKKFFKFMAFFIVFSFLLIWLIIAQPSFSSNQPTNETVNTETLKAHVKYLSEDCFPRNENTLIQMEKAAAYIEASLQNSGCVVERQEVMARSKKYSNVIGRLNIGKGKKIIVGAHYDSCWLTPGADDNASGVAGLLELAQLANKANLGYEIEFVAYALEEPPYFGGPLMGSVVHSKSTFAKKEEVEGVIILEMIGYFSDKWFSQKYPIPLLYLFYPNKGNFVTVVGATNQMSFTKQVKVGMQGSTDLPVFSINAPTFIPGIDFSDHRNYWANGYNAVMITDTAFYRNLEYHQAGDTYDRLDYDRMGKVVLSVFNYLKTK